MPGIKSSIGTRTFTATPAGGQSPLRTFEVPDETESFEQEPEFQPVSHEIEAQIKAARQSKMSGQGITPQARERLEYLAEIASLTRDVKVGGTTFTLRTLKAKENRAAILAASKVSQIEVLFEGRCQQLARSIIKIDGADIDYVLGTNNLQNKINYIEEFLDENLVNYLYEQYSILNNEALAKFSLKSEEDVKELVEDVKK